MTTRFAVAGGEGDSFCQVTLVMTSTPSSTLQFRMQRTKGRIVYLLHLLRSLASGIFTDTKLPEIVPDGEACHCSVVELQGLLNEFVDSCKGREELLCCDHIREFLDEPAPALLSQPSALFTMGHRLTQLEAAMAQSLASLAGQQEELRALARDLKKGGKKAEKTASFELAPRDVVRTTLRKSGSLTQSVDLSKDSSKEDKGGASSISSGNSHTDSDSSHSPSDTDDDEPKSDEATGAGGDAGSNSLPSSAHLERLLYVTLHPTVEGEVDALVRALQPLTSAVAYRASMQSLLGRAMRSALNCESYESGLHALRCFLPDDALKISAVICRNHSTKWHRLVSDKLAASRGEEEEDMPYSIRNVVISNSKTNIQVHCSADQQEVEISCNARQDVCMLALLEQIAVLVAPGLFKRSLLLIRAWWAYETASYADTPVRHYLSDLALAVMVGAIFNQHHASITSPLGALCAFLAEYADYDGSTSAITLQGIVRFKTGSPALRKPQAHHLLSSKALDQFWLLYSPLDPTSPEGQELGEIVSDGASNTLVALSNTSVASVSSATKEGPREDLDEAALAAHHKACARNLSKFERYAFNVVCPFSCTNMLAERPSANRVTRLAQVLQGGAAQMSALLKEAGVGGVGMVAKYFPTLGAKCKEGGVEGGDKDTMDGASTTAATGYISLLDRLVRQCHYCNLMIESIVSRSAILDLVVEVLVHKGPLPIGEIGKAIAELTCIPGLSVKLKEAYGGLKKFLGEYKDVVIIGSDHPFNPHVVLRESLSADNLRLVDSGIFPTQAIIRMKRATPTSLRKNAAATKQAQPPALMVPPAAMARTAPPRPPPNPKMAPPRQNFPPGNYPSFQQQQQQKYHQYQDRQDHQYQMDRPGGFQSQDGNRPQRQQERDRGGGERERADYTYTHHAEEAQVGMNFGTMEDDMYAYRAKSSGVHAGHAGHTGQSQAPHSAQSHSGSHNSAHSAQSYYRPQHQSHPQSQPQHQSHPQSQPQSHSQSHSQPQSQPDLFGMLDNDWTHRNAGQGSWNDNISTQPYRSFPGGERSFSEERGGMGGGSLFPEAPPVGLARRGGDLLSGLSLGGMDLQIPSQQLPPQQSQQSQQSHQSQSNNQDQLRPGNPSFEQEYSSRGWV